MPPGTPYRSFALPYPIRVDSFTDTLDDLPPPYNRPPLHLLTHTHSDHIHGLASASFAQRVICSPDAKEMLLHHEICTERLLHDYKYRAEKKKTFGHLKVDPCIMPNGRRFFAGSRDLLQAVPLNTPTEFDISVSETVTITLIDANHCPGSVMFLIEGPRGAVLHTGDLRAEPWFLSSIQRNHFLQPYLADSSGDLQILVARKEGTHTEAKGLVKTLEAIYLDTACLLSSVVVPSKERAVQGVVELIASFPSSTYFFINAWTWGYEDVLKAVAHAFHCKIHLDRYKHLIYSRGSDPFLRALGTRDPASTRFHACERFDRCSFVDVPSSDHGTKGAVAPPSREGKKVVYVNAVNMGCARWEEYRADVRRRVRRGENVDSLLVPLSRHSTLPELMNFVTLFRPHRVVPNTLDPSLGGLDWGAMSKMFSGCLSSALTPGCLESVTAPPCSLTGHPSLTRLPGPSTEYDSRAHFDTREGQVDTAFSNMVGPGDTADEWGDNGRRRARMETLRAWMGDRRRAGPEKDTKVSAPAIGPRTPKKDAREDDSDQSSDEGGSDDHARTAWKFFGVGELEDEYKTWVSPSPQSPFRFRPEAVADMGTLPTPTSSPLLCGRGLEGLDKGEEYAGEHASQSGLPPTTPERSFLKRVPTEVVLPIASHDFSQNASPVSPSRPPLVSFNDARFSGYFVAETTNEAEGSGSQSFTCLHNVALPGPYQDHVSSRHEMQHRSLQTTRPHGLDVEDNVSTKTGTEEVDEIPKSKRRKIDGEEPRSVYEMCNVLEQVDSQDMCLFACGWDETCSRGPSVGLTRTQTTTSFASENDQDACLPWSSSDLGVEEDSEASSRCSSKRTITAVATISFPVRKRTDNRINHSGKTASLGASGRAGRSTSAIVRSSALPAVITPDESAHAKDRLVSPRAAARRTERAERRRITEKLREARPDLAVSRQSSRSRIFGQAGEASTLAVDTTSTTVFSTASASRTDTEERKNSMDEAMGATKEDVKMDWERSRRLAERVREAVRRGDRASKVLPRLTCVERWYRAGDDADS